MKTKQQTLKNQRNIAITAIALAVLAGCNQTKIDNKEHALQHDVATPNEPQIEAMEVNESSAQAQQALVRHRVMSSKQAMTLLPRPIMSMPVEPFVLSDQQNNENYLASQQNPVKQVVVDPVSTFSVDVDTGSYSNTRRFINNGKLPPADAVREEAFINYFNYDYAAPTNTDTPFKVHSEVGSAPWNNQRQLLKIGIKGFEIPKNELKAANLVFLLDVSGSMNAPDKLPLLKTSLTMLTKQLGEEDSVAIVVYAGAAGVVLPATAGNDQLAITSALKKLAAGGSTNGAKGIELAYEIAQKNFKKEGVNRVILATDGDFNVGTQSIESLKELIAKKRETGIALTTLGFGQGNYNDGLMEQLANIGNGQHAYIDNINEARKVLVDELSSTLQIIAKDVKIQVEFNPQQVAEYRLVGYQNRLLANEDFNNDKVDAAEIGAGHTVTAIYELTLADSANKYIDDLRYKTTHSDNNQPHAAPNQELAFIKVRYKKPNSDTSELISQAVLTNTLNTPTSSDFKFSSAVTGFAQLLKGAKYTNQWQYEEIAELATQNKGEDLFGYRSEFIQLVKTAAVLE
jgi:Ca-activated chloride channel family protein